MARQQQLREQARKVEKEMRLEERRLTEAIFQELKTVIRSISIKEKLDLVLEKNAAQIILYTEGCFREHSYMKWLRLKGIVWGASPALDHYHMVSIENLVDLHPP